MPSEDPRIGEVWRMRDAQGRETRGVIADVSPTQITVVSFNGHRARLPPASFALVWEFAQAAPRTGQMCARRSCLTPAAFRVRLDGYEEYRCARHIPVGVQSDYLSDAPVQHTPVEVICPSCASPDPIEDLTLPRAEHARWTWWVCGLCSRAWISISNPPDNPYGRLVSDLRARHAWYREHIDSAVRVAGSLGEYRIEAGSEAASFYSHPTHSVHVVGTLAPDTVHVILLHRTHARRAVSTIGVQRLGGRPNRPEVEQTPGTIFSASPSVPVEVRPEMGVERVPVEPTPPAQVSVGPSCVPDDTPTDFSVTVPPGSRWRRRGRPTEVVEVIEHVKVVPDGRPLVHVLAPNDPLSCYFPAPLFIAAFTLIDAEDIEEQRLFDSISISDEWCNDDGVVFIVRKKNAKRRQLTVELPDGRESCVPVRDFKDLKKVVRRNAYEQLRRATKE